MPSLNTKKPFHFFSQNLDIGLELVRKGYAVELAEDIIENIFSLSRYIPKTHIGKINKCVPLEKEMKQIWRFGDIKGKLTIMLKVGGLGRNDLNIRRRSDVYYAFLSNHNCILLDT